MNNAVGTIAVNATWMYVTRFVVSAFNAAIAVLILKSVPVEGYAFYGFTLAAVSLLSIITYLGIANSYQRYLPEMRAAGDRTEAVSLYVYGVLIRLLLATAVYCTLFLLRRFWAASLSFDIDVEALAYCAPLVFGRLLIANSDAALGALLMQRSAGLVGFLIAVMKFTLILVLSIYQPRVEGYLLVLGAMDLLETGIGSMLIIRRLGGITLVGTLGAYRQRIINYAKYSYLSQVQNVLMDSNIGVLIAAYFLSPQSVAFLTFALIFSGSIYSLVPLTGLQEVIVPAILGQSGSRPAAELAQRVGKAVGVFNSLLLMVYTPLAFLVAVFAREITTILSREEYLAARGLLALAILFRIATVLSIPTKMGLVLMERPKELFNSSLVFLLYVPLVALLAPFFGAYGVVSAWGTTLVLTAVLRAFYVNRAVQVNFLNAQTLKAIMAGLSVYGASLLLGHLAAPYPVWLLLSAVSVAAYTIFVYRLCAGADIRRLVQALQRDVQSRFWNRDYQALKGATQS